jgi:hypothetical protein
MNPSVQPKTGPTAETPIPLLEEYKLCDNKSARIEAYIWQTAGLFGAGSLLALGSAARELAASPQEAAMPAAIGALLGILLSLVWWRFAQRWWSIQHLMFDRMREIDRAAGSRAASIVKDRDDEAIAHKRYQQTHGPWPCRLYNRYFDVPNDVKPRASGTIRHFEYRGMWEAARLLVYSTIMVWLLLLGYALCSSDNAAPLVAGSLVFLALALVLWRLK